MGERRKRKSLRETEEETKHLPGMRENSSWTGKNRHFSHGSGRYHELYDSKTSISRKFRDDTEWQAWESVEEHPIPPINCSFKNSPEGKEMGEGKKYFKKFSPQFDGPELHNYGRTHEYDRSHPRRSVVSPYCNSL